MLRSCALVALFALACGSAPRATTIENRNTGAEPIAAGPSQRDGALWTCQIGDYDPQPCKLSRAGGAWRLAKLLGSQRFRGELTFAADRATFRGEFFCPWGDCTEPMDVGFDRISTEEHYVSQFGGDPITLRYDAQLEAEYAGAGYGGLTGDER
jgi:hypothetical protein